MRLLLIAWVLASGPSRSSQTLPVQPTPSEHPTPPVPAPLGCLLRRYPVQAVWEDGRFWVRLPDGSVLPYDDGVTKTPAERIEHPDIEDMFAVRYRPGRIAIPVDDGDDPGRTRVAALFRAVYGAGGERVRTIHFLGQRLRVHADVRGAFDAVARRLEALVRRRPELRAQLLPLGGGYAHRNIAGTTRPSAHAYGIAVDINPRRAAYWRWSKGTGRGAVPASAIPDQAIVDAFEAEGFIWGGRWYHFDTMHFEYRPELLDPACVGRS
jgi:hypothetical protein